ncbi:MAG: hypothetical protein F4Z59_07310 [Gemmatimonadales bacterium]|nr:hypothetical protein [Gemmatimonadales bacterium]
MGEQLMPAYANGEYALGAQITTDGGMRESLGTQQVTLKNSSRIEIAHHAGRSVVYDGRTFHGGPTDDSNTNSFSACPVSYKGTMVGELTLSGVLTDRTPAAITGGTPLSFQTGSKAPDNDPSPTLKAPPFTWTANSMYNGAVANTAGNEYWVMNTGDIKDDAGALVTDEFRANGEMAQDGPFQFDFAAPTATGPIMIGETAVTPGKSYSAGPVGALVLITVAGTADNGVGLNDGAARIHVGDCAANPLMVNKKAVDRSEVDFVPIPEYSNVSAILALAEEDAARASASSPDTNGRDCYVAELAELKDKLGNAWKGEKTVASWLQTPNFGVDKTAPVITDVESDAKGPYGADPVGPLAPIGFSFELENPKLKSGDDGTPLAEAGIATIPGATPAADPVTVGFIGYNLANNDDADVSIIGPLKDGAHKVTFSVLDGATPPNIATTTVDLVYDATDPTFSGSGPVGDLNAGHTASVAVSGMLKDATTGIKEYTLTVRDNSDAATGRVGTNAPAFCEAADPVLPKSRADTVNVKGKNAKAIDIGRVLSVARQPSGAALADEELCVLLQTTDAAGNSKDFSVAVFRVDWGLVPVITLTDGTLTVATPDTIDEAGTLTFNVALSQIPTDTVRVTVSGGADSLKAAPTTPNPLTPLTPNVLTFTPGNYDTTQEVTVTSAADENVTWEKATFTMTASGGGYDGITAKVAEVVVNDPDIVITADVTSVNEGDSATVVFTATRGDMAEDAAAVTLTATFAGATANTADAEFSVTQGTVTANSQSFDIPAATTGSPSVSGKLTVTVAALQETGDANDDAITVTFSGGTGDFFPTAGITIKIVDDDK